MVPMGDEGRPRLPVLSVGSGVSSAAVVCDDWYVACTAAQLVPGKVLRSSLYGLPIVLFRDEQGEPVALLD